MVVFNLFLKEPGKDISHMFFGRAFQTVGAAKKKALCAAIVLTGGSGL